MNLQYGIDRFMMDMSDLGYALETMTGTDGLNYGVLKDFEVPIGRFQGRVIDLGIPIPNDYPRLVGTSIQIRVTPQLLEYSDSIPNVRNIIVSPLGTDWRYWSFRFEVDPESPAKYLIHQIHGIFQRI